MSYKYNKEGRLFTGIIDKDGNEIYVTVKHFSLDFDKQNSLD